jgi:Ca-activated chloride channel homolog
MAAGKKPDDLTVADVQRPEVVEYVANFQGLVDHYMPATLTLNTKIAQGVEYGHFFLMPEDNLVSLLEGNETWIAEDGTEQPIKEIPDLVMIYPTEGAVLNANPAGVVNASWVTDEYKEGALEWIDFLLDDSQQEVFLEHGFRPPEQSGLMPDPQQFGQWGLDAAPPAATIEPGDLDPAVLQQIISSWSKVRNPAIVTFVVDRSGSMTGQPIDDVRDGLKRVIDSMSRSDSPGHATKVGLVTFSTDVTTIFEPSALADARFGLADAIDNMSAGGDTALYDAIARAVVITDRVDGDPRAKRSVVVLSDGRATGGSCLSSIVEMTSRAEVEVTDFCGMTDDLPVDETGAPVAIDDLFGTQLAIYTENPVQIFFLGFGEADPNIGRILAQATGAEYQASPDGELAAIIEKMSGYF